MNEKINKKEEEINNYKNPSLYTPFNDEDSNMISFSNFNTNRERESGENNKDKEISKLKRRINKLVVNLSQKDQNILILNDDVIYLEEQLNEVNEKNKVIKKENENLKKIISKNNIQY